MAENYYPSDERIQNLSKASLDLRGFEKLWGASYEETEEFLKAKQAKLAKTTAPEEFKLLQEEKKRLDFEQQKLLWQLGEREKELKIAYDEIHALSELNKKLNDQLEKYKKLLKLD